MRKRAALPRRTFLRGVALGTLGVRIGLPLLEVMLDAHGTALAQNTPLPRRFGVFFFGNGRGVDASRWKPSGSGSAWTPSVQLAPLAELKPYLSVVTGMNARLQKSPQGHHKGSAAILSGHEFIAQPANNAPYRSTFSKPSIDQLAAIAIGKDTPFKSLELGISRRVVTGEGTTIQYISHNGPDSGNPPEIQPRVVFDRLFAGKAAPTQPEKAGAAEALRALKKSVLDVVLDDLTALRTRVGSADRTRLDQHAESIRAIERRLAGSPDGGTIACAAPARPAEIAANNSKEPIEERMAAMADLLALALSCDLTRVFSIQFSGSAAGPVFWQVGATRGHHDLSHDGASSQAIIEACTIFTMKQFAVLLKKLRDTPDGAGNLLDSLAILCTSDHGDGAAHSVDEFPVVIAGRAGGALVHPGVHYASKNEHTNRVLLTLLRAVGVTIPQIGEGNNVQTMGVAALESR